MVKNTRRRAEGGAHLAQIAENGVTDGAAQRIPSRPELVN